MYGAHSHEDACALARAPEWVVCYLRTADVNCRMSSALRSVGVSSSPSFTLPGTAFEYDPGAYGSNSAPPRSCRRAGTQDVREMDEKGAGGALPNVSCAPAPVQSASPAAVRAAQHLHPVRVIDDRNFLFVFYGRTRGYFAGSVAGSAAFALHTAVGGTLQTVLWTVVLPHD